METYIRHESQKTFVLSMSTLGFIACFAVWVVFSIIGKPIQQELGLNNAEFGMLIATPILTGAFLRPVLGAFSDKYGGRRVFFLLMVAMIPPLYALGAYAMEYWHFIVLGLLVGPVGASFAVGISYVVKWYPKEKQGFAMGVFGAGNIGTALTQFIAPLLVISYGWRAVPKIYAALLGVVALVFLAFTFTKEEHKSKMSVTGQFSALADPKAWRYFQYYSFTFGGFVALALWMPSYYMNAYGFSLKEAGILVALMFALPGSIVRAYGGWLSDKYGAHKVTRSVMWVAFFCLTIMAYPPSHVVFHTINGNVGMHIAINMQIFTAALFILGLALGIGNASIFKYAADDFQKNTGAIFGSIGLGGGLGGYLLPIIFGAILDFTGIFTTCFMFLWGVAVVSLVWMYWAVRNENGKYRRTVDNTAAATVKNLA